MGINISRERTENVRKLLNIISPQFSPSLSESLDLDRYAVKLSYNATFISNHNQNKEYTGCIVFYTNKEASTLYVPLVWVDANNRRHGIAKKMFEHLIQYGKNENFNYIDLEVLKDNYSAKKLYYSLGFQKIEERIEKNLMRLNLKQR